MRSDRRAAIVAGAALVAPVFFACNALVGLDAFDKVACVRDCEAGVDAAGDVLAPLDAQPDASDAGADTAADAITIPIPDGASPTSWARWKMPNPPDAGGLFGSEFSYASAGDAGAGTVTDLRTSLVWNLSLGGGTTFDQALKVCQDMRPGTWRLPTRIELVTLIDYTRASPAIDPTYFPNFPAGLFWTSSVIRPPTLPYHFWVVDFATGKVDSSPTSGAMNVICVEGA